MNINPITPPRPQFPLAPVCRRCNWKPRPQDRKCVTAANQNGNVDRPFYKCFHCSKKADHAHSPRKYPRGWITWDDERGIHDANPRCDCGALSRQDRAGKGTSMPGMGFWTCATGSCDYFSRFENGMTDEEMRAPGPSVPGSIEFTPWLL